MTPLLELLFLRNLRRRLEIDMMESAEAHVELVEAILIRHKETARRVMRQKLEMFADRHLA